MSQPLASASIYPTGPTVVHPEWSRSATIYQINTRQFTPEGTFAAAAQQLPRLKELGVGIVWLMPIHEIGELNRKGVLGSPYAVRDYYSVNSEFGTKEDLRAFVDQAHELGLHVILDWVANHTAWDSVLREEHPEFYELDAEGNPRPTMWWDWDDIIDLDFTAPGTADYMTEAMKYWVREFGIDGYRCDVGGLVPTWFWNRVRRELEEIQPVFMLAEWESRDLHEDAFDMTYAWSWTSGMLRVVNAGGGLGPMREYYAWNDRSYPRDSIRMQMVSNHDMNAWDGTEFERFGDALEAAIVLTFFSDGMPLVYNGQEAGNEKSLEFFDRDPIEWREHTMGEFYRSLIALKSATRALDNGAWGGRMIEVKTSEEDNVLAFTRSSDSDEVLAIFNLSNTAREATLLSAHAAGSWAPIPVAGERKADLGDDVVDIAPGNTISLPAWGWAAFTRA
ncbi:MAG: alpha-amylase family glycosyl hydrolase [Ancrocorticia sp.]